MRRAPTLAIMAGLSAFLLFGDLAWSATKDSVSLEQTVKERKVYLEITGLGGSTGDTIVVTVQRRVSQTLRLTLTAGTVFKSTSGAVQDMAGARIKGERVGDRTYRPMSEIVLTDDAEHTYIVEAYCLDFHKANPRMNDSFSVKPPDPRVARILTLGSGQRASIQVIQSALWIDRDNVSAQELRQRFPVSDADIEKARALLEQVTKSVEQEKAKSSRAEAEAWVEKGLAMGDNSDTEAKCYRKAVELDPTYAAAHFNLGYVHQTQGTLKEALDSYQTCIKHDPGRADAYLNMGTLMSVPGLTQDLHGARAALGQYLELRKDAPNKAEVEADILAIEKKLASLKKAEVKKFCDKKEIEARLSSGFKRGASPYAGPRLPVRIQFAHDSDEILSESEAQLAELADALKGKRLKDAVVLIEGHADSKGSIAYNDKLSRKRAESIKRYLVSRFGIPESRFRVEGKGELQPIQPNDTPEHMATNRRVEFVNWTALEKVRKGVAEHPRRSASDFDQFFK